MWILSRFIVCKAKSYLKIRFNLCCRQCKFYDFNFGVFLKSDLVHPRVHLDQINSASWAFRVIAGRSLWITCLVINSCFEGFHFTWRLMGNLEGAFDEGGALQKEENRSSEILNHSERLLQHWKTSGTILFPVPAVHVQK